MKRLEEPTKELAEKILGEVGFQDRLIGHKMRRRMGPVPVSLYSLEEAVRFLSEDIPQLDLDDLQAWVGEKIGDRELARAIEETSQKESSDQEKILLARGLMIARLAQCKGIAST